MMEYFSGMLHFSLLDEFNRNHSQLCTLQYGNQDDINYSMFDYFVKRSRPSFVKTRFIFMHSLNKPLITFSNLPILS